MKLFHLDGKYTSLHQSFLSMYPSAVCGIHVVIFCIC